MIELKDFSEGNNTVGRFRFVISILIIAIMQSFSRSLVLVLDLPFEMEGEFLGDVWSGWVGLILVKRVSHYPDYSHFILSHAKQGLLELLKH